MKWLLGLLLLPVLAMGQTLSLSQAGSGNTATITVTSSGQFKLQWSAADNWGLDGWWDLVNDPTTNLASPAYGVNGPAVPCGNQAGLANLVFYSENDEMGFSHYNDTGCNFPTSARSATVVTNTPSLVVIETTSIPSINSSVSSLITTTLRYYVTPSGWIPVRAIIQVSGTKALGKGAWGEDMVMEVTLPNSLQTGTSTPDTQSVGWVRATTTQNPYNFTNPTEPYYYAYWGSSSGAYGYGSSVTPKASLMIVPSPANVEASNIKQAIHTWGCGAGCGATRLGYNVLDTGLTLNAGQSITYDWLIQLGTQGSGVLPNMTITPPTNCSVCTTIANAYIANPNPTAGLLTAQTPNSYTLPSGWTLYATQDFESGTFGTGAYGNGNFVTTQAHPDGNGAHTHSIECQVGGTPDCGGNVSWNKPLAVGTRELYVSWYEWLDTSFRMNDEMFLMRLWWNTGTGQPSNREAVFDYFQNSNLQYNSTDATLLWNIQFAPGNYYQNKLPTNVIGDGTNFPIATGRWQQHEMYTKFSTTQAAVAVGGTVTLNTAAKTYTCSACDWIALGAHVGDSPHFTGLSDNASNGIDQSGGAYSYFITALTSTVMTVTGYAGGGWSNQTVSGATVQIDHADGAYTYYKDGQMVGYQLAMINPGSVDWATQATNLSIGESYSKLIWHAGPETSAPFSSACSSNISGIGYDNFYGGFGSAQYGWDGAGHTATSLANQNAGIFSANIRCDATWGGPMPTPPVFKRYLDDIIVLTKNGSSPPSNLTPIYINGGAKVVGIAIR